jgi:hypothetical protein
MIIPALRRVAELARRHAETDPDLAGALQAVDAADAKAKEDRYQALLHRGMNCAVCGERFISWDGDPCCSVGCRFGGKDEP